MNKVYISIVLFFILLHQEEAYGQEIDNQFWLNYTLKIKTPTKFTYGGDIYRDYNDRPSDTGIEVGQVNKTTTFNAELQSGYLINPSTNLKVFANISYRNFNPEAETLTTFENSTVWFTVGFKTDLFNWYFDY